MDIFRSILLGGKSWRQRHGEPQNRRQLFLCVLSDQFFSISGINFLYALFWLPFIIWTVYTLLSLKANMDQSTALDSLRQLHLYFFGLIPCFLLIGPAKAGMALTMRNWAKEEYTPALNTFFKGFRENLKQALTVSAITAIILLVLWYSLLISLRSGMVFVFYILLAALILFVLFLLSQQCLYCLMVTYDLPLRSLIKNAVILTLLRFPTAILILAGSLFPILVYIAFVLIRPQMLYSLLIIPVLYYLLLGFSLTELIQASWSNMLCDRFLNK